jgi:phage-related protein
MSGWTVEVTADARAELEDWPTELRASLARIVERLEAVGLERVGEPFVRHLEGKLWEMRPSGRRVEGRALYVAASGRRVVIVLAFQKRTQKTPRRLIELALRRAKGLAPRAGPFRSRNSPAPGNGTLSFAPNMNASARRWS